MLQCTSLISFPISVSLTKRLLLSDTLQSLSINILATSIPFQHCFHFPFQSLLPKGCCRVVPYSHEYEDSWRCNFLGLSLQCELPEHVLMSDLCVLLEILDPPGNKDGDCPSLSNFTFEISTVATMPEKGAYLSQ